MSAESIANLRKRFDAEVAANGALYHQIDIDRVRTEDFQVSRYLVDKDGNEDQAFDALIAALKWKKSFGVHDRTDQTFAKEFWELNGVELAGRDKKNQVIQWEMFKNQHSFKETNDIAKWLVAHCLEQLDRTAGPDGFILVMDTNGAGLSNIDMELVKFKLSAIEYYPGSLRGLYVVDLPWLLNSVMKIIISFMSPKLRDLVIYMKKAELTTYMDPEHIPTRLGGTRDKINYPDNTTPLDQMAEKYGMTEKFIDHYYNYYKIKRTNK